MHLTPSPEERPGDSLQDLTTEQSCHRTQKETSAGQRHHEAGYDQHRRGPQAANHYGYHKA